MKLKMGTRGSTLALAQSGQLARQLQRLVPGLEVETAVIKTSGDLFQTQSPKEAAALASGTKGLFVKEIEEALIEGEIDFAVHSGKDLPAELAPGCVIAAWPEREDPRDAFIGRDGLPWAALKAPARVATSSLRRRVQLLQAKPGLELLPMRGNVDTRVRKLREGACDGLILAAAGLNRLGRTDVAREPIPVELIVPAPAQGALAVEVRADQTETAALVAKLDHAATRLCVEFERTFLKKVGGGCSTPLGAYATADGEGVALSVFWSREDGSGAKRMTKLCSDSSRRDDLAAELAAAVRA
ncbi:MAG: hydroxymethylbilane synthase [Elusimicrobia bacterium]|nr:hydroxymethylbilane synthase [Elusimicrobiota bacterium]